MATQPDIRQIIYRGTASRLTGAANSTGDTLVAAIDKEVTPLLQVSATSSPSLVINVGPDIVANPTTSLSRTIPPISNIIPSFSSATITFPSSGTGTVTTSAGSSTLTLAMSASQQMLVAFSLDANGNINLTGGTPASSITAPYTVPQISGLLLFGFAIITTNGSNVVQSITNASIYQVPVGGGGGGTGNANTILETIKNQLVDSPYQLVTTNIVATNAATLFSTITGAAYDIVTNTVKFTADGQTAVSTNQLDTTEFLPQGVGIGSIDLSVFWDKGTTFAVPTSKTLTYSAISVTNTSATVTVTSPSHGLTSGKKVYIQTSAAVGGITAANLSSNSATITVTDSNTFTYTAGASATSTTTGTLDFIISGFVYLASRDGGSNYFPVNMSRVGTTEAFYGSLQWGLSQTTEASAATLGTLGATGSTVTLNATNQQVSQNFTVPANANWVVNQLTLNITTKNGTPVGNLFAAIYAVTGSVTTGTPTGNALALTSPLAASGLTTGANTITFPSTVLTGGTAGTVYAVVISSDSTYQGSSGSNNFALTDGTSSSGQSIYNGTSWANTASTGLRLTVTGYSQDLRLKIFSASDTSLTYPVGLDGYGLFYNLQNTGIIGATKKTQRFVFNSVTDNLNSFTITNYTPDPDLLSCFWVEGGQVFKAPAFQLSGNVATFPANTFNQGGVSQTITLIFDNNSGGAFDGSDSNANLLAQNHLGSSNGAYDKSAAGRGPLLRDAAGTLRELELNTLGYPVVLSSPGGSTLRDTTTATTLDDTAATRLGFKIYSHGTTYNGGLAPTVTLSSGGGSLSAVNLADFIPYQTQDGNWRLKFNITASVSSASRTNAVFAVNGLTFFATTTVAGQAVSSSNDAPTPSSAHANPNANTMQSQHTTATTSEYDFTGDVRLASKPTWAY